MLEQHERFLLSLFLIDNKDNNKHIIKELYSISNNIENNYNIFQIKKHNGRLRTIYEPNPNLKYIQRNILEKILSKKQISKYAKAYYKGLSLVDNALPHINKKIILKLDIENFFDNIDFINVYESCFSHFPKNIGQLFTNLSTYNGYLPQGAPTSSYISNLVMKTFDNVIGAWCDEHNISYTRYSDDMTFSGDFSPNIIVKLVRKQLYKLGLKLNNKKIRIITSSARQSVTGVVVNKKAQVSNTYRRKIRQEIYYIKKFGLNSHLNEINYKDDKNKYLNVLYGKILYVLQINKADREFNNYKVYLENLINSN